MRAFATMRYAAYGKSEQLFVHAASASWRNIYVWLVGQRPQPRAWEITQDCEVTSGPYVVAAALFSFWRLMSHIHSFMRVNLFLCEWSTAAGRLLGLTTCLPHENRISRSSDFSDDATSVLSVFFHTAFSCQSPSRETVNTGLKVFGITRHWCTDGEAVFLITASPHRLN